MEGAPLMIALAGPNGAGKTSYYYNELHLDLPELPFLNADIIQRFELQKEDMQASYEAAQIAAIRRQECLAKGTSFIWESTFSHPSKPEVVAAAKKAGFRTRLIHIGVSSPAICISRVALRVEEGGHNVPEHKVIERYHRNGPLIRQALELCDEALVFDNSVDFEEPSLCLRWQDGRYHSVQPIPPDWIRETYPTHTESA